MKGKYMEKIKSRSSIFYKFSLQIYLIIFPVLFILRTIQQDYTTSIALVLAISLFLLLYVLYKKSFNEDILAFTLNIGMFILITGYVYAKGSENLSIIWILTIPILGYTLLFLRVAFVFSLLGLLALYAFFYLYNDVYVYDEKFRLTVLYVLLTVIIHVFARQLDNTVALLQNYNNNLENKVNRLLKSEQEREKLFIQTSKLASLGELLSSIAHQWKQPISSMSAIIINMRVKEELSGASNSKHIQFIDELDKQIQFMIDTMDDFRSFFKSDEQKISDFNMNQETKRLIHLFDKDFKAHNININYIENTEKIIVSGYPNMYQQALLNLITNARDAIENNDSENKNINILLSRVNDYGLIIIEDHAGGIPEQFLEKIFDKHFSTKGERGNGIGLTIVKEIIEDFCLGKLTVENINGGARFSVYIPIESNPPVLIK